VNLFSENKQSKKETDFLMRQNLVNLSVMMPTKSDSKFLVAGNSSGMLHIFRKKALEIDYADVASFDIEKVRNNEMHLSRTYSAHSSRVIQVDHSMDNNFIFSSAIFDQAVIQFRIMEEDIFADLDFFYLPMTKDPFLDIMAKNEFVIATEEFWPLRDTIKDVYMNIKEKDSVKHSQEDDSNKEIDQEDLELELTYVLGRKAIDRRNNLKYDGNNRLIYTTSSYVLFLKVLNTENFDRNIKEETSNKNVVSNLLLKQEKLLPVENFDLNIQREISCFAISRDKKEIAVGHNGNTASVSLWEINTESMIMSVDLKYASVINILKFSYNNEKIIGTAVHKFYYNVVFVIDIYTSSIQCVWLSLNTLPYKIKDMEFLNNSVDNFVTVGIQHFALWRVKGSNLEYSNIPIPQHNSEDEHYFDQNDESNSGNNKKSDVIFGGNNHTSEVNKLKKSEDHIITGGNVSSQYNLISNDQNKYGICLLDSKENIYDFARSNDCPNPEEKIKISFLGVAIFENSIIGSTDSGYLYVFAFERIFFSFKIKTHNSPITSIEVNVSSYLMMSGAMDGTAILYGVILSKKLSVTSIKKLMIFNTFNNVDIPLRERIVNPNYNIQSVAIGMNKVCIGTRSGNIYEFTISEDMKIILNRNNKQGGLITNLNQDNTNTTNSNLQPDSEVLLKNQNDFDFQIKKNQKSGNQLETFIKFQDNDVPISLDFDIYSTRVFTITKHGNFRVWSLINFHVDFEHDFKNKAIQSYHFRSQNIILLIFDYQIIAIDTSQKNMNLIPQYKRLSAFEVQIGQILQVKISPNERILAGSLLLNGNPTIYIYDVLNGFVLKNILDKFDSYIRSMDFSVDSNYLIIEDNIGNTFHYEIQTRRPVTLDELNFEIEWMNDGLKYSDHFRCLPNVFGSDMMRITKISKHPNGRIVAVGDYTGVLRLFIYPAEEFDSYFTCRTDHIAKISHIVWSNDMKFLATLSEQDRTVYIYRLV